MSIELKVGVDVAHGYAGSTLLRALHEIDNLVLRQVPTQQDFIADAQNIGMTGLRDFDRIGEFDFVLLPVVIEPDADHRTETRVFRDGRNQFVALAAGKGTNPACIRLHDGESLTYLVRADLCAGALALDVGTERHAVNPGLENFQDDFAQFRFGELRDIDTGEGRLPAVQNTHWEVL